MTYNNLIKGLFSIFYSLGIFSFGCMSYLTYDSYTTEEFYKIVPATAILLSALIAATTIMRNVNYNEELDAKTLQKDKENKTILIKSHLKYFIAEADEQIKAFTSIIDNLPNICNGKLNITPFLYDEKMNENKIIKNLDYLLSPDLHKYSEQSTIELILKFKAEVLEIIHDIQIMQHVLIPNKQSEEIKDMLKGHIKSVHDIQLKLISLRIEI